MQQSLSRLLVIIAVRSGDLVPIRPPVAAVRVLLLLALFAVATVHAAEPEQNDPTASDAALLATMAELTDSDAAKRKAAIATLAQSRDGRLVPFLTDFSQGSVIKVDDVLAVGPSTREVDGGKVVDLLHPLTRAPLERDGKPWSIPEAEAKGKTFGAGRAERKTVADAITLLRLFDPVREQRLAAVQKAGDTGGEANIAGLKTLQETEQDERVRRAITESIAIINLTSTEHELRVAAVKQLGELVSSRALPRIRELAKTLDESKPNDAALLAACRETIGATERWQTTARGIGHVFSGISLGSVLVLMALGLSIVFGLMGVINMAHGEMLMIGAYATFLTQEGFKWAVGVGALPAWSFECYFLVAIPMAMVVAGAVGLFIEWAVIRHLYGRPLETLLATFGVSFILIQSVRLIFGNNKAVNNPAWLQGGWEIAPDVIFPYNRIFIIVFCAVIVGGMYLLIAKSRLGLMLRATTQNRTMASSLGVNTRRIDGLTFALGSGIAGMAGCALTLISNITPDMGQAVIVDSFMVVVAGGVGKLAGAIVAGVGLGCFTKTMEPWFGAVWGQVLMLVAVVVFLQWKPSGLFPAKGRLADA
jgi:urea transport system permease protein